MYEDAQPITDRQALIEALRSAADLEHDVVCRYLFAAFSLKSRREEGGVTPLHLEAIRDWRAAIYRVAREEMGHLGFVCNLLTAIGAPAHFAPPKPHRHAFSMDVLDAFIRIERDHDTHGGPGSIGALYARIGEGFRTLGRANPLFFVGSPSVQVDNECLDLPPGWFDFNLHRVVDLQSAENAIDQILEESEGDDHGHADAFLSIRASFETLKRENPSFAPVRPVAANPTLDGDGRTITHPITRKAAQLFNESYELMLMMMLRFFNPAGEQEDDREVLKKTAFYPLMTMVLRPLGEMLTRMPLDEDGARASTTTPVFLTAGPTFESRPGITLSPHPLSAWTVLGERLDSIAALGRKTADDLTAIHDPWALVLHERVGFLSENLTCIARDFRRQMDSEPRQVRHLLRRLL